MLRETMSVDSWLRAWSTPAPPTYQGSEALAFQRWFKFKEAFSPELVRQVIESLPSRPRHLMDCFGGSGTSGVVARLLDINATLIEVNPFLADLIEAKFADYRPFDLPSEASGLLASIDRQALSLTDLRNRLPPTFVEPGINGRWIFWKPAAKQIERIRHAIQEARSPVLRRIFSIALASILIEASNVRIDGKARRYRGGWQHRPVSAKDVTALFVSSLERIIEDVSRFPKSSRSTQRVLRGDSRKLIGQVPNSVDLAIFSPPYPNSFDYTDIYNVELWMMGYFGNSNDNAALRQKTLRSHVQVAWDAPLFSLKIPALTKIYRQLDSARSELWDHRLPEMVVAYFEDMNSILAGTRKRMSKDGHAAIVVGNSAYGGITVDSNTVLQEIARSNGFKLKSSKSVRVMRSSMQQTQGHKVLDEWLMLFKAV
jgi:hypothetical protein